MESSDEEIISKVINGRTEMFAILVERYQKQIFNLMLRYSRSENDAADLTQDVFVRVYEKLASYKHGYNFFSWLYKLALNIAHDWSRKNSRLKTKHQELHSMMEVQNEMNQGQETVLQYQEEMNQLQDAMQKLPEETREILFLRYHHNRSVQETAEIFSISQSAVKMRTSRGIKQLQELMRGKENE